MGRTLASSTQLVIEEQQSFQNFRRALRRQHQIALDEMFASARKHTPAMAMAGHALPFETILLAMLLEEHVTNKQLRQDLDQTIGLIQQVMDGQVTGTADPSSDERLTNQQLREDLDQLVGLIRQVMDAQAVEEARYASGERISNQPARLDLDQMLILIHEWTYAQAVASGMYWRDDNNDNEYETGTYISKPRAADENPAPRRTRMGGKRGSP